MRIIGLLRQTGTASLMALLLLFFLLPGVFASDDETSPAAGLREVAVGRINTGSKKPLPLIRTFFYSIQSENQLDALYAKMKKRFPDIDEVLAGSLAEKAINFEQRRYIVIFGHSNVIETGKAVDYMEIHDRAETVVSFRRGAKPGADEVPSRELGFIVASLPRGGYAVRLKILSRQGTAVLEPFRLDTGKNVDEGLKTKYRMMLDSTNLQAAHLMYELGRWCEREGLFRQAGEHYSRSLVFNPLSRRSAEALRRINVLEMLEGIPETLEQFTKRACALMSIGKYKEALKDIESALKLDGKNAETFFLKAEYYRTFLKLEEAGDALDSALEIEPRSARYYASRARCYAARGLLDKADADILAAASIASSEAHLYAARAFVAVVRANKIEDKRERRRILEEALLQLGDAIEAQPDIFDWYIERAAIHLSMGNGKYALQDCIAALRANPYHYLVHINTGKYYLFKEEPLKAEECFNRAVEIFSDLPYVYKERGRYYIIVGDNRSALADFSRAIEMEPDAAENYYSRARVFSLLQRADKAVYDMDKAVEMKPEDTLYRWERASLNYNGGDLASALEDYRAIIDLGKANASVYYMVGLINLHQKEKDRSIEYFLKALKMNPEKKLRGEIESKLAQARKPEEK